MVGTWFGFQWLPVRGAPARCTPHRPESPVTLDVALRILRMSRHAYGPEFVVRQRAPSRLQMEQLQLVAFSGADGNSMVIAPQWQVPMNMA